MKNIFVAVKIFIALTIITGIAYPLIITGIANAVFPEKANGSFLIKEKNIIGSKLIGQKFAKPEYFWGRPSAINYNPMPSGGSNLNPVGEQLKGLIRTRLDTIRKYHGNLAIKEIPKDLLFASGSGVDPHISPEAAYFQINRIAKYRGFSDEQIIKLKYLIDSSIESRDLLIFGEPRINVLILNMKLMEI